MKTLQFIGGGQMGTALLGGMLEAEAVAASDLHVCELSDARRDFLLAAFPGISTGPEPVESESTVLCVKPQHVDAALRAASDVGCGRVLSIVAGVTLRTLEALVPAGTAVIRAMPNTPSLVGMGAAGVAGGTAARPDDVEWALDLLSSVGIAMSVTEQQLEAVTGLSGSGPAYFFLIADAMIDAGVLVGMTRAESRRLVAHTLAGAAALMLADPDIAEPTPLRASVTSPGGTTAAATRVLEGAGVRSAMIEAVVAAATRASELGG